LSGIDSIELLIFLVIISEGAERNKDIKPEITPEIIDTLRNLPDKRFNDQADLAHAIQTTTVSQKVK
jgi:hypothetical protein